MKKLFALIALFSVLSLPAWATINIDGSVSVSAGSASTSATLSTTQTYDIIIVFGMCDSLGGGSLTIADTAGLSWGSPRVTVNYTNNGNPATISEWSAKSSGTLSSDSITVTLGTGCTNGSTGRVVAFGISGANQSSVFDGNASFPASNSAAAGTSLSVSSITTNNANDLAYCILRYDNGGSSASGPSGFSPFVSGGTGAVTLVTDVIFSALQSNVTWTMSWTGAGVGEAMICDAIMQASASKANLMWGFP